MNIYITEQQYKSLLAEGSVLSNNGAYFGNTGWCLILMGAPGSGKSYFLKNNALINGKIFDVDEFKARYERFLKRNGQKNKSYNEIRNGAVAYLKNSEAHFINAQTPKTLNNVIFDICGRPGKRGEMPLAQEIIEMVKPLGYRIILLWVVCNRSVAMLRNVSRGLSGAGRKVIPDKPFHARTNQVNKFVPSFLQSDAVKDCDLAYIAFTSSDSLSPFDKKEQNQTLVKLDKSATGGFIIPQELQQKINIVLGPAEKSTGFTPQTYLKNANVKDYIQAKQNNKENFLNINETMEKDEKTFLKEIEEAIALNDEEETTYQEEFEQAITDEFEELITKIYDVRRRAKAYLEQEEPSPSFERTLKCIDWVCENYAFAPFDEYGE